MREIHLIHKFVGAEQGHTSLNSRIVIRLIEALAKGITRPDFGGYFFEWATLILGTWLVFSGIRAARGEHVEVPEEVDGAVQPI